MPLFPKPISEISKADIEALIARQHPEDIEVEFKATLAARNGVDDPWITGQAEIGSKAKEALAKEVIAFANTQGGTLVLGIEEDEEGRAKAVNLIPKCKALADRLGASIMATTDPKITSLEAVGVPIEGDAGVVILRVPASFLAPHRDTDKRECYVRRGEKSEPMGMREIQDLTINRTNSAARIEARLREGTLQPFERPWFHLPPGGPIDGPHFGVAMSGALSLGRVAVRAIAIPLQAFAIPDLAKNQNLKLPTVPLVELNTRGERVNVEPSSFRRWTPYLRGIRHLDGRRDQTQSSEWRIAHDGSVSVDLQMTEIPARDGVQGVPAIRILDAFAELICMAHLTRCIVNRSDVHYAMRFEWMITPNINVLPSGGLGFRDPVRAIEAMNHTEDLRLENTDDMTRTFRIVETTFWHSTGRDLPTDTPLLDFEASVASLLPARN